MSTTIIIVLTVLLTSTFWLWVIMIANQFLNHPLIKSQKQYIEILEEGIEMYQRHGRD